MNVRTKDDLATVCSVTEMAAAVKLSRSRFYQLIEAGVFPPPVRCDRMNRPFYPAALQRRCREIRRTGIGLNGQVVLFYGKRRKSKSFRRADREHRELTDALQAMGLTVTVGQVNRATAALYLEGMGNQPNRNQILGDLFRHLSGECPNGV